MQRTLISTLVTVIPLSCLYLAIGTLLFVFYQQHPQVAAPAEAQGGVTTLRGLFPAGGIERPHVDRHHPGQH